MLATTRTRTTDGQWQERYRFNGMNTLAADGWKKAFFDHDALVYTQESLGWSSVSQILQLTPGSADFSSTAQNASRKYGAFHVNAPANPATVATDFGGTFTQGWIQEEIVRTQASDNVHHYIACENNAGPVTHFMIEDVEDSAGTLLLREVYGVDESGAGLVRVTIDYTTGASPRYWCTVTEYDDILLRIENIRYPSCFTSVDSDADVAALLDDPYGYAGADLANGLVRTFEYTAEGFLSGVLENQHGTTSDAYVWAAEYGDGITVPSRMMTKVYDFPQPVTVKTQGIATSLGYEFWDASKHQVKKVTTTLPVIPTSQNGSGIATVTERYYDKTGRLRWTKDGDGYINYLSYDSETGQLSVLGRDVDSLSDPANGAVGSLAWTVDGASTNAPTRAFSSPAPLSHVSVSERDSIGRVTKTIDPDGKEHIHRHLKNAVATYPFWNGTSPGLPFTVLKTTSRDEIEEVIQVKASQADITSSTGWKAGTSNSDFLSWRRLSYDDHNRVQHTDNYHNIPSSGYGAVVDNFSRTSYLYDQQSRVDRVLQSVRKTGGSTVWQVTRSILDALGRPTETQRGFGATTGAYNDLPSTMSKVSERVYDMGDAGDGYLTAQLQYYGNGFANYGFLYRRDNRGLLRGLQSVYDIDPSTVGSTGTSSSAKTRWSYVFDTDWQGTETASTRAGGVPNWPTVLGDDDYVAQNQQSGSQTGPYDYRRTYVDDLDRAYRTELYDTSVSNPVKRFQTNYHYDRRGNLVAAGRLYQAGREFAFDGLGRRYQSRTVTTLSGNYSGAAYVYKNPLPNPEGSSSAGFGVNGDEGVSNFVHTVFDVDSNNVTETHLFEMAGGWDGINLSGSDFVRSSAYQWYDDANRLTAMENFGCGDPATGPGNWRHVAAAPTRLATAPSEQNTDQASIVTTFQYFPDTRQVVSKNDSGDNFLTTYDQAGRRTEYIDNNGFLGSVGYRYDDLGQVTEFIIAPHNAPQSEWRSTLYTYDESTGVDASWVSQMQYPDGSQYSTTYRRDGQVSQQTDSRGNVMDFDYLEYGESPRLEWERLTTIGSDTDNAIRAIRRYYDSKGRRYVTRSYALPTGGSIRNDVYHQFSNQFDRLEKSFQSHEGAFNTSTTPFVHYGYDGSTTNNVFDDGLRMGLTIYPSGKKVNYTFDDFADDKLNRISRARNDFQSSVGTYKWISRYYYTGTDRPIKLFLDQPNIDLSAGSGSDFFNLDRFGAVKSQVWKDGTSELDRHDYVYNSQREVEQRTIGASFTTAPATLDQSFTYNSGHGLDTWTDGSSTLKEDWNIDGLGNWTSTLTQTRTHDDNNKLTGISTWSNPFSAGNSLKYAGNNLIEGPDPTGNTAGVKLRYDAWNRLVKFEDAGGHVVSFEYDGLHRRIVKADHSGDTEHYYYNNDWQVLEVRKNTSTVPSELYQWHPHYIDALAVRYHDSNSSGTFSGDEIQYVTQDANFNTTALIDSNGIVLERYAYEPFGEHTILDPDFGPDSGVTYASPYLFTGRRFDSETGLHQYRWRHYDSGLGRFLERDPIGYVAGMNHFAYVANSPLHLVDPMGLDWLDTTDRFIAGFSDAISFGATTKLRSAIHGSIATRNHQGAAFAYGQGVGTGYSLALGYGAGRAAASGVQLSVNAARAVRAVQVYEGIGTAVGVYQSSTALASGCFELSDAAGFLPLVGDGVGRAVGQLGRGLQRGGRGLQRGGRGLQRGKGARRLKRQRRGALGPPSRGVGRAADDANDAVDAASDLGQDDTVFRHFTDEAGFRGITESGVIRANNGKVFLTKDALNADEAFDALFIGNPNFAGRGNFVFEFTLRPGVKINAGSQVNEFIHNGSLRFGRNIDLIFSGPNPF